MAFRWRADNGPKLNADMVALCFFRGSGPVLLRNPIYVCNFQGGGGVRTPRGYSLIFPYIRRLGSFFWVQNFEFQYFGGFSEKKIFWGMKILWIFFWGHHKIGLYLGVISMHFWVFY